MKLHTAIEFAIECGGLEIICTRRLLSYLVDLQAYENPAIRHVVATIVNEGFCHKPYAGLTSGSHQSAFNNVSYQLTEVIGLQERNVRFVLDSILYATNKISLEPTLNKEKAQRLPLQQPTTAPTTTDSGSASKKPTTTFPSTSRSINGHEYVDLGLSVKWATCNVGASSASDYGSYFAWGETSTKSEYRESNSKTCGKTSYNRDIGGDTNTDAARANWGSTWRLPTTAEFDELLSGCTWQWTTQGGHNGYKVTSKTNGNSIFLPAAGWRYGSSPDFVGEIRLLLEFVSLRFGRGESVQPLLR